MSLKSKNVMVTGGAGFIGSNLVDALVEDGAEVFIVDNMSTGRYENVNAKAHFYWLDLTDAEAIDFYIEQIKPEVVFHLAALARIQPSIEDPIRWNNHNANATLNLLQACSKHGVKKVVYSGSSSVYGDNELPFVETQLPMPKNPYALSKAISEKWCELYASLYGLNVTILRYFNVYGPRQVLQGDYATVVGIFKNQRDEGRALTIVADGTQRRDFTYVKDIVRANILAAERGGVGPYNIGTGVSHSINQVADLIEPDITKRQYGLVRKTEAFEVRADNSRAKGGLGWVPRYSLEQGIMDTEEHDVAVH
jgi:UDP-glucose 4-epimerase